MTVRTVIDNTNRPASPTFYHGGAPGLAQCDAIHPPSITRSTAVVGRRARGDLKRKYREDRVFITPDFKLALLSAAMHPSGNGVVYNVEPIGELEIDLTGNSSVRRGHRTERLSNVVRARPWCSKRMFAKARYLMAPPAKVGIRRQQPETQAQEQRNRTRSFRLAQNSEARDA